MTITDNLLVCLAEECFELSQECNALGKETSKALRFGIQDQYKEKPPQCDLLVQEFYDICGVMELLYETGVIEKPSDEKIKTLIDRKKNRIKYYAEYSKERDRITK